MQLENVNYLKDQLKYLGFGETLNEKLEKGIEDGHKGFSLKLETEGPTSSGRNANFELNFSKSATNDYYFFNNFKATLIDPTNNDTLSTTFLVDKTKGITAKESINLREGRAVLANMTFKGQPEKQLFVSLNFNETKNDGSFKFSYHSNKADVDIVKIINDSNLVLNKENDLSKLIKSLEKGNLVKSNILVNDKAVEGFVSLDPVSKSLHYLDKAGNNVNIRNTPAENIERSDKEQLKDIQQRKDPDANGLNIRDGNNFTDQLIDDMENGVGAISQKGPKR